MNDPTQNIGVGIAILDRFTNFTLPRLLDLKQRVDEGARLEEWDIDFLREVLERAEDVHPFVTDDPVSQELYAKAIHLYHEITEQGLLNEQQSGNN